MAGLTFDDAPPPNPQTPLSEWFEEWVLVTASKSPSTTLKAYVGDAAVVGARVCAAQGKVIPESEPLKPPSFIADGALSPITYGRAHATMSALVLLDLHPRVLGGVFDTLGSDRSSSSVRRAAASWSSYCQLLVRRGILASNPMLAPQIERPARSKDLPKPISIEEAGRLLSVLREADDRARHPWPERDVALCATLLGTGLRLSEAIEVCVGDMRTHDGVARLSVLGKGRRRRTVVVTPEVVAEIKAYLASRQHRLGGARGPDRLFVRHDDSPLTPRSLERLVERWFVRAGVRRQEGALVHSLRHTYATFLLDSGASIREVQEALGHESLETTQRYLAVNAQGLVDAAHALPVGEMLRSSRGG